MVSAVKIINKKQCHFKKINPVYKSGPTTDFVIFMKPGTSFHWEHLEDSWKHFCDLGTNWEKKIVIKRCCWTKQKKILNDNIYQTSILQTNATYLTSICIQETTQDIELTLTKHDNIIKISKK